jgi:hypothetical protein
MPVGVLDALLEGAAERDALTLREDAGSRARWAKWEKEHLDSAGRHPDHPGIANIKLESASPGMIRVSAVSTKDQSKKTVMHKADDPGGAAKRLHQGLRPDIAPKLSPHEVARRRSEQQRRAQGTARDVAANLAMNRKTTDHGHASGDKVSVFHPGNQAVPPHTMQGTVEKVTATHVHVRDASGYKHSKSKKVPRSAFHSRFGARLSSRSAPLNEAEVGKPGTNWKQVTPENRKKVDPLVKHWMKHAHPFTACYNELAPEKGAEAAKRICAVVKDMGMRTTKWRKGGSKVKEVEERELTRLLTESLERLVIVEEAFGKGAPEGVAALAGRKNAAGVKVGLLNHHQVGQLAHLSRHGGSLLNRRRRKLSEELELTEAEAILQEGDRATHGEFPARVKDLRKGEVARMPDGTAVRRVSTLDGRDAFQVGEPSTYSDNPGHVNFYGGHHRTADEAIQRAGERSARSTDPESLGGASRFHRHGSVRHNGADVTFRGVDAQLRPLVAPADNLAAPSKIVQWGDLTGRPRLQEAEEEPLEELSRLTRALGGGTVEKDPRGKHQKGHVVRFEKAMRANRTQDNVTHRVGVITGFHKQSHDPVVKDLVNGIERKVHRSSIISTHGPLSGHSGVSNWAKWNREHPERSHRRLAESASGVADADVPFFL